MTALNVSVEEAQIILSALNVAIEQQRSFHGYATSTMTDLVAKVAEQLVPAEEVVEAEVQQVAPKTKRAK